jgi:hypothetical protein
MRRIQMKKHDFKKLNKKQLDTICGGSYYTWRCHGPMYPSWGGSGSSGGSGGSHGSSGIEINNNINIVVVNIIGNYISSGSLNVTINETNY